MVSTKNRWTPCRYQAELRRGVARTVTKKGRKRPVNTPFELQLCGKHAAAFMSLIQSARMNGHDPYAYLKDVLTRLPTQKASEIEQLLPHQWMPG